MIYLKEGNTPLNEAWADEIYQEGNSTYQLTFKYHLNNDKWKLLTEETKLISDDLDGEQEFTIFEVVKEQGYITVYANQVMTLLNYYSISSINVDRVNGNVVMTALAGAILRDCPFSFYSDITDKHTFNAANISVMDALIKEKHSIVGQWGGDLVRDKYQVSLLKNGGSETEALFMYKKNMRSPQQTTSTKELRTRIHFRKKIEVGEGDNRKEQWLRVTVDSPLISKYKHIYEDDMEVTDEDVKDLASLTKYGEQYYRTTLCDMIEDSLELDVAGVGDVPVKIFDVVSVYHEQFEIDVRKKITKYRYSPMGKRLKSVGFGTIQQTLGGALNALVSDSVKAETAIIEQDFEVKLEKELKNADKVFDQKMNQMEQSLSDEIEQARAKTEEVKAAMTDQLNLKINQSKSEVTDRLQKEFDQKLSSASADLAAVRANLTQAQSQLTSNIAQIRSDVGSIRTKQGQQETEIGKQVQALNAAKTELAGVKSAQATFEQSTTRRLAELTNLADGKASKSELVQTAEELASKIASVHVGGRNLLKQTRTLALSEEKPWITADNHNGFVIARSVAKDKFTDTVKLRTSEPPKGTEYVLVFYARASRDNYPIRTHFYSPNTTLSLETSTGYKRERSGDGEAKLIINREWKRYWVKYTQTATDEIKRVFIGRHGSIIDGGDSTTTVEICAPALFEGNIVSDWSPAYEDQDERVSAVESSFKQRADSIEAGVNRLTEGLKTKADSSALTVLSDRISASVKSLETDTDNKLNSKLSTAEFDVRANRISQEILNATKDKADKTLVTAEAGKLREELASLQVGGVNLLKRTTAFDRVNGQSQLLSETYNNCAVRYFKNADANSAYQNVVEYSNALYPELGGTYTLSFWAKGTGEMTTFFYGQRGFLPVASGTTSQGLVSKAGDGNCRFTLSADWKRYYVVYKLADAPADATSIYKHVLFRHNSRSTTGEIWLAGVKLERGNLASDYSENPEDTEGLITEAKTTFERTAQGLRTDLTAVQAYVNADGTRSEALRTFSREETARQLIAERKLIEAGYVGKATYAEDVKGISRQFEELKSSSETKLAEFKQGIDGQFATMSSQIGETLKKTDISITPGQITLGTGKVVNGQTLASLFVQNPESMQAITKLMRITGDLIVDGSITGRDLAAGAITTPHLAAGAVTAEVLGANAVTADKVKADDALLEKLSAGEALLRKLMAKDAFINKLQSIDFTAEQVKGGMIKALNGALKIDLNNGQYNVMTDQAAIRRVLNGYPNQFLKFTSETEGGAPASVTVLGANRDGTENSKNDSFAGIRLFSGNKVERTEIISDVVRFATGAVNYRGWEMRTLYGNDNRQVILQPFGNVTRSNIVANYFNGIDLVNVLETLNQMMANLGNHTGRHDIFGPIRGLGARKYVR